MVAQLHRIVLVHSTSQVSITTVSIPLVDARSRTQRHSTFQNTIPTDHDRNHISFPVRSRSRRPKISSYRALRLDYRLISLSLFIHTLPPRMMYCEPRIVALRDTLFPV